MTAEGGRIAAKPFNGLELGIPEMTPVISPFELLSEYNLPCLTTSWLKLAGIIRQN